MPDQTNAPDQHDHDKRVHELFMQVIDLPQQEQRAFLDKACGDDTDLCNDVLELLRFNEQQTKTVADHKSSSDRSQRMTLARGETIGPYTIIDALGEGGFGVVYLAKQTTPVKRLVALKIIKPGMDTKSVIARFDAERQALAMMDHSSIARVFEAGATPEGRPYFAMEFVKGEPINAYCDRHKLDTQARLELFAQVCDAVQHAHQKGVIHRDLKPGNILVTIDARRQPQPKVIDFGIAKATAQQLTEMTIFTQHGQLIGTPEYMSPEQAEISAVNVDTRSDVYSLGVILYELLSGKLPFDPESLREAGYAEIQRIIREDDPPKPSTKLTTVHGEEATRIADARKTKLAELQSTLRRELEWIPLKAMRKDRTERYSSAEDLGKDVRRYLKGEPLEAGPESTRYRVRKFVARRRVPIAVGGVFAALLLLATVVSVWLAVEASSARNMMAGALTKERQARVELDEALGQAEMKTIEARKAQTRAEDLLTVVVVGKALNAARKGDPETVRRELGIVEEIGRGDRFDVHLARAMADQSIASLPGHESSVWNLAFSPDGLLLASASFEGMIHLWDVSTGQPIGEPMRGHKSNVWSLAFNPDGSVLASGSSDQTIRLWDVSTGQPIGEPMPGHESTVWNLAFSPDGSVLTSGSYDGTIRLWDVSTGQPIGEPLRCWHDDTTELDNIQSVAFSPDGSVLAGGFLDNTIHLWDLSTCQPIGESLRGHAEQVRSLAFNPDGSVLASGSTDDTIRLWDLSTGQPIGEPMRGHDHNVSSVAFSPDGSVLVSGSSDNTIRLWHASTGQPIGKPLRGHAGQVNRLAFSPDGSVLASGSGDNTIRLWHASTDQLSRKSLRGHEGLVSNVAFSPDGSVLTSGSYDGTIRLWDVSTGQPIGEPLRGHNNNPVISLAFSPDGSVLASAALTTKTIDLWDLSTGQPIGKPLRGHAGQVQSVAFSPDGSMLASGSFDKTIRLWDLSTGQPIGEPLRGHENNVSSVAFSPDGSVLASGSTDNTIRLWDASTGQLIGEPLRGHEHIVNSMAFSPDGSVLASGSADETIRLWDLSTGQLIGESLRGHKSDVWSVTFSPDGSVLASGSADETIRLWDLSTGQPIGEPLRGHAGQVQSVAFSPDGSVLASGSFDKTIRLWHTVPLQDRIDAIRAHRAQLDDLQQKDLENAATAVP